MTVIWEPHFCRREWHRGEEWWTAVAGADSCSGRLWWHLSARACLCDLATADVADWSRLRPAATVAQRTSSAMRFVTQCINIPNIVIIIDIRHIHITSWLFALRCTWTCCEDNKQSIRADRIELKPIPHTSRSACGYLTIRRTYFVAQERSIFHQRCENF